jgi:hypothetical protein
MSGHLVVCSMKYSRMHTCKGQAVNCFSNYVYFLCAHPVSLFVSNTPTPTPFFSLCFVALLHGQGTTLVTFLFTQEFHNFIRLLILRNLLLCLRHACVSPTTLVFLGFTSTWFRKFLPTICEASLGSVHTFFHASRERFASNSFTSSPKFHPLNESRFVTCCILC